MAQGKLITQIIILSLEEKELANYTVSDFTDDVEGYRKRIHDGWDNSEKSKHKVILRYKDYDSN